MSVVGRRIRKCNNDEAIVREVASLQANGRVYWWAMVRLDDGRLESWELAQCVEIEHKPTPYVRPPPTSIPGEPEPAGRLR